MWTTLGEISNYGTTINIQVDDIDKNQWILELEDIEKETANIIQRLSASERSVKGTRHKFSAGSILYSKLRTYLNKVLVAPSEGYCTTEIMPFDTYGIISNEYICHVLRSPFFLDYTLQCGYGVKMPRLSTTDACNGMIPLPPLNEQIRIVEAIKYLLVLIDIIESGKENLQETIKQAKSKILDLAIHGKLVPQDPTDEPASKLLKRINPKAEITSDNGHYQKLPKGWCLCLLNDVLKEVFAGGDKPLIFSKNKSEENYIPIYANGTENKGLFGFTNKAQVYERCLTISARGTIGFTCIREVPFVPIVRLITAIPLPVINLLFLKHQIDTMLSYAEGSSIPQLTIPTIKRMLIILPPLKEQLRIVAKIEELFALLDTIKAQL